MEPLHAQSAKDYHPSSSLLPRSTVQIHKIMQGLLDQHTMVANPLALGMVEDMAKYFCNRCVELSSWPLEIPRHVLWKMTMG